MTKEIFKDIPGYEGKYQASNLGNIKSLNYSRSGKERLLKQTPAAGGYLMVSLCKEGKMKSFQVHQLVAMAFLNHVPCGHKLVVDHMDDNHLNNNLDNLQVVTNRENLSKDKKGGSSKYVGVSWNKINKKWRAYIHTGGKRKHLGSFTNELEASEAYKKALYNFENGLPIERKEVKTSSIHKGVSWYKDRKKWKAQIQINGKRKNLGSFTSEIDAHHAYQKALYNLLK